MKGFFITGTDTGVGKTYFAQTLMRYLVQRGQRVAGFKPVASGCRESARGLRNEDAEALLAASNIDVSYTDVNPHAFRPPIAPHWAARQAGVRLELDALADGAVRLGDRCDWLVVEGAGGILVPVNEESDFADLALRLGLPVILVVGLRLGAINHALLSADVMAERGLSLGGWVGNHMAAEACPPGTLETLQHRLAAPCLGIMPWKGDVVSLSSAALDALMSRYAE